VALVLYGSLGVGKTVVVARAAAEAKKDLREAGCVVVRAMYQPSVLDQPSNFPLKERVLTRGVLRVGAAGALLRNHGYVSGPFLVRISGS
jgi:hypothetical protein